MTKHVRPTLADPSLPSDVLAEMEKLNKEVKPLNIWLRTQANAPMHPPWHRPELPPSKLPGRAQPAIWKWKDFEHYLYRIAEIAPLEFTERQQFLLMNPGFEGALKVTNSIRVAVSIYKPGDNAKTHRHTPNASRTILSNSGGYTTVERERCVASRGDLILTPNGTWHGHGNDSDHPVIWIDVLDWPLLEYLDAIWIDEEFASEANVNSEAIHNGLSSKMFGNGGITPKLTDLPRGEGNGSSPLFHYKGTDIENTLTKLKNFEGNPWDAISVDFTNPLTGKSVFTTLGYSATLLRPLENTAETRSSASVFYIVIAGTGYTEVAGQKLTWSKNDLFVVPNHTWHYHVNKSDSKDSILYAISDQPLLEKIGHFRRQWRQPNGQVSELTT